MSGWIGELDYLRENEDDFSKNLNRVKMAVIKQFSGDNSKRSPRHLRHFVTSLSVTEVREFRESL
jgi:hypothetical protein